MQTPRISAIAAIGKKRELGKAGGLIWQFSSDFARMKVLVKNKPLIMGRKTYESIGRELPYAPSIVITRDCAYQSPFTNATQTHVVTNLQQAIEVAKTFTTEEIIIFGGAHIYAEALPLTDRLYLTVIDDTDPAADTFFPSYAAFSHTVEADKAEENSTTFTFLTLERP